MPLTKHVHVEWSMKGCIEDLLLVIKKQMHTLSGILCCLRLLLKAISSRHVYVTLSAKTDHLGLFYNFQYACKLMGGAYFRNFW